MTQRDTTPLSERDGIPYAQIFAALQEAVGGSGAARDRAREGGHPRWDNAALVTMFKRLGTVPPDYSPRRAALRVLLAADEMAQAHSLPPEQIHDTLVAFCDDSEADAFCGEHPRCPECPIREHCRQASRRPSIKELPETERPRERLLSLGAESMSDAELLAIVIGGGSHEESALALARRLLATFGSLQRLAQAGTRELQALKGIGKARAAQIRAGLALGRRLAAEPMPEGMEIKGSRQVFEHFRERVKHLKKETFLCLLLDTKHRVMGQETVAVGSLNESLVHPREVFRPAVRESADCVLFVHNHPSGDPTPSSQDRQLTRRLREAGDLFGIKVLDHVIIGRDTYHSFAEQGELAN